jgi:hypothetical protein
MSNDKFKNSPIHDKKVIISMMDELKPEDMAEVVELIKSKQPKQQTAVERFFMALQIRGLLPNDDILKCYEQAKELEKEQIINARQSHPIQMKKNGWMVDISDGEKYYEETYVTPPTP